jgi:hypothetical protein
VIGVVWLDMLEELIMPIRFAKKRALVNCHFTTFLPCTSGLFE